MDINDIYAGKSIAINYGINFENIIKANKPLNLHLSPRTIFRFCFWFTLLQNN